MVLVLAPHHLVNDAGVTLDNLNHLVGHVLVHVVWHGNA